MRAWIDELEKRTEQFAVDVIHLSARLESVPGLRDACWQVAEAAGSVASNHRAMRTARSDREFASKLQTVNEEINETVGWLQVADRVLQAPDTALQSLLREARELRALFGQAKRTTRERLESDEDDDDDDE